MTEPVRPTPEQPITVGPYQPHGRTVWILRHDGTLTDPVPVPDRATFEHLAEICRPLDVYGPWQITWADQPDRWPGDE